jgi:hypothetical protein
VSHAIIMARPQAVLAFRGLAEPEIWIWLPSETFVTDRFSDTWPASARP